MARSLIRKEQLNQTDMSQIIGEYGSGMFISKAGIESLLSTGTFNVTVTANLTGANVVYTTGTQTIPSLKNFTVRPQVNGTGVLLQGEATQGTQVTLPSNIAFTTGDQTFSGLKTFSETVFLTKNKGIGFTGTGTNDFYGIYTLSTDGGVYDQATQSGLSFYAGSLERMRILSRGHIAFDDYGNLPRAVSNTKYKVVHLSSNENYSNSIFSMASRNLHTIFFGNNSGQFILGTEAKGTYGPTDERRVYWSGNRLYGWLFKSNLEYDSANIFEGGNTVFFVDGTSGNLSGLGNFIDRTGGVSLDWNNRRLSGRWSAENLTVNNSTFATQNSLLNQKSYAYIGSFFTPNHNTPIGDRWFVAGSNNGYDWDTLDINITGQEIINPVELRDPSIIKLNNKWYIAFTQHAWKNWPPPGNWPINSGYFMLAESNDLTNWNYRQVSLISHFAQSGINDIRNFWGPEWFQEDNGDVYLSFTVSRSGWVDAFGEYQVNGLTPWIIKATDYNLTGWTGLTRITGFGPFSHMPDKQPSTNPLTRVFSGVNDISITKVSGLYYTPFVDAGANGGAGDVGLGISNNLFTGWRKVTGSITRASKSWFGTTWNGTSLSPYDPTPYGFEGLNLKYLNGKWRLWVFDASAANSGIYCEGNSPSGLEVVSLVKSLPWRFDHGTVIKNDNYQGLLNQYDDQNISGLKNFTQRPTVNNTGLLISNDPVLYTNTNQVLQQKYYPYLGTFFAYASSKVKGLVVGGSKDGYNWDIISNRPYGPKADLELRDPSIIKVGNKWSVVFTEDAWGGSVSTPRNSGYFGLLQSTDLVNWDYRRIDITQQLLAVNGGQNIVSKIWGPEWFQEDNGDLYVNFTVMKTGWEYSPCANYGRGLTPWIIKATDYNLTGWTGLTRITGTVFPHLPDNKPCPATETSGFNDHYITKVSGLYYCLYVDQQFQQTRLARSTNLFTGWELVSGAVGNWYGTNFPYQSYPNNTYKEGGSIDYYNGKWRMWIFDELAANSGLYFEGLTPTGLSFVSLINCQDARLDHGSVIQNNNYEGFINQYDNQTISGVKTFTEPITLTQNKGVGLYDRSNQFYGIYGLSSGANHPTAQVTGLSVYLGGQEKLRLYNNGHVAFDDLSFMPGAANNPMYKVIHFASNLERTATIFSMASKALHTVFFGNNTGQFVLGIEGRPGSWPSLFPGGRQFGWLFKAGLDYMGQNIFEGGTTQFFIDAQNNGNLSGLGNFVDANNSTSLDWNNRRLSGQWNIDSLNSPLKVGRTSLNTNGGVLHLAGGVSFPGTQVSASDANTLDDYEEYSANSIFDIKQDDNLGSYTITQSGIYTKIGNVMLIQGRIQITSATKVGTQGIRLSGSSAAFFPNATSSTVAPDNYITFDHWASLANGVYSIYGIIPKGQNYIELYKVNGLSTSSTGSRLTNQDINIGTQLGFQGFYYTST